MRPFQKNINKRGVDHQFKDGTEFKQIVNLYSFDRELRLLIMDAIERVEVAIRATLNNVMANKYQTDDICSGSHWYLNKSLFKSFIIKYIRFTYPHLQPLTLKRHTYRQTRYHRTFMVSMVVVMKLGRHGKASHFKFVQKA